MDHHATAGTAPYVWILLPSVLDADASPEFGMAFFDLHRFGGEDPERSGSWRCC
jgi:hypothetical protein